MIRGEIILMIVFSDKRFESRSDYPDTDWTGTADYIVPDGSELANKIELLYPNFEFVFDNSGKLIDVSEPIDSIINKKKQEVSKACEYAILTGVNVGDSHYSMTIEDQANILAWMAVAQTGQSVPYHADGQACRIFTSDEFMKIANAAIAHKTHHTTYCNLLMRQIEEMTVPNDIKAVEYGVTALNDKYQKQYNDIMASLAG